MLLCSTALVAVLAGTNAARAQERDYGLNTGAELVTACRLDGSGDRGLCEGFLLGYIQAHPEIGFRDQLPSEYMQRVMRTRAPDHPETAALKSLVYCLEDFDSLRQIREAIAALAPDAAGASTPAGVVEQILDRDYRCSR
jgi:hypothetical protein